MKSVFNNFTFVHNENKANLTCPMNSGTRGLLQAANGNKGMECMVDASVKGEVILEVSSDQVVKRGSNEGVGVG